MVTSPSWEDFIVALEGAHAAKFMLETGLDVHYAEREFPNKEAYRNFIIAQRAVVIIDSIRRLVAMVTRVDRDKHGARKTSGQSLLVSASAMKTTEEVLMAKVKGNIKEDLKGKVVIAVNESPAGRYVFMTHRAFADSSQVIEGKGTDTKVSWRTFEDALSTLGPDKAMECAILRLMMNDLEAAS